MKKRKLKKEINRCKKDLAYFFEKYVKFKTLDGHMVSSSLTAAQKHILHHCKNRNAIINEVCREAVEGNQKH